VANIVKGLSGLRDWIWRTGNDWKYGQLNWI